MTASLPDVTQRLVSLCPSLTELVFDLGCGDRLVGRTRFCIHPAAGVDAVERVGGTKNPRIERILELRPDLVLMNEEENRREDAEALRGAGVAVHASMPRTAEDTARMVRDIAAALGEPGRGEVIAASIEAEATRVRAASAGPAVRYAYVIWRDPWMVAGDDTFVAGLLGLAGGVNVARGGERYPEVTLDGLRALAPEVVLLASEPFPFAVRHVEELSAALGWPAGRFELVDGELLSWHGSRTPRGIAYAGTLMARVRAGR